MSAETTTAPSVTTVARDDIRAVTSVRVDGKIHQLGQQRDFRRNGALAEFLPEAGRPSFAWVRLRDGETLAVHRHPTKSMILVCSGSVLLLGTCERELSEGDVVCVPPESDHGFRTRPGEEFHGLSVQFEGAGLYEHELVPRASFGDAGAALAELERLNESLLERHTRNALFALFGTGRLQREPALRARFFAALYVWSVYFQRMLHARQAACTDMRLRAEYGEHLREELGHDRLLLEHHDAGTDAYDTVLEAAGNWFVAQMHQLDEAQKIVLVHMVVESSGHAFGLATSEVFQDKASKGGYFNLHAQADEDHRSIGRAYLRSLPASAFPRLMETCRRAWDQMDLVHERVAAWTMGHER
ncbi:cupin domain-containing protein [Streptosporangium sp. NPDC051023]|uniref:cupin domain-containing protein n=1 Tax=Streptosporangium sp. NPDC051023 TaxID=3155410 RepID=UPI003450372A